MRKFAVAAVALVAAAALIVPLQPGRAAPRHGMERFAVVIGISKYKSPTKPTVGGAGDADVVRRTLLQSGFPPENIVMLVDGAATLDATRSAMRWLVDRSRDDTFTVFHFSGHVKLRGGDRDRDGEAVDEELWLADNRFMVDREFVETLRGLRGDSWINIAGCEAAGFDDGLSSPRRLVTASSQEPEKSYERPDWGKSVFVGLMIDQGIMEGRADANRDRHVSLQEAFAYAAERAPAMTRRQSHGPQHPYTAGGDGTWYLNPPPPPPLRARAAGPRGRARACAAPRCPPFRRYRRYRHYPQCRGCPAPDGRPRMVVAAPAVG